MQKEKYNRYSFILDRTARKVKQYAQSAFAEHEFDITVDQWIVLKTIFENPNLSNKDLAEQCGKDQPTLTRIIDILIKKGLVARISHPSDRRSLQLETTENGANKIKEIAPQVADFRMKAWQNLDEKDFEHFVRILDTIYTNLTPKTK